MDEFETFFFFFDNVESEIPGSADAAVLFVKHSETRVFPGKLVDYCAGAIGRAIIDHKAFPVLVMLVKNGLQTFGNVLFYVVNGDNYCDF